MATRQDNIIRGKQRNRNTENRGSDVKVKVQKRGKKKTKIATQHNNLKKRRIPVKRGNDETAETLNFPKEKVNWNTHIDIIFAFDNLSVISEQSRSSDFSDTSDSECSDASEEEGTLKRKRLKKLLQCNILPEAAEKYKRDYKLHELTVSSRVMANEVVGRELSVKVTDDMMLSSGKLVLLLDLDNTLLHAISQSKLDYELKLNDYVDDLGDPELYTFTLPSYADVSYYLKLRPRLREFLHILSFYYEMSIYTNATREYADVVIAILDPDRSLFMDRIIARGGGNDRGLTKSARRLYPKLSQRFVVSFDDRRDVWTDIDPNQVLKAHHYSYFMENLPQNIGKFKTDIPAMPNSTSKTSLDGKSQINGLTLDLSQSGAINDSSSVGCNSSVNNPLQDFDMHLMYMTKVFLELHKRFYSNPLKANVGTILAEMQKETLSGVGIFFTGFRKNVKNAVSGWTDCEVRQKEMALEFGAHVVDKLVDKKTTHVVAAKNCTDNLIKSREPDFDHLHKVHFLWLYSCRATWQNVSCDKFDVDTVCNIYSNTPPLYPGRDHWKCLYDKDIHGSLAPLTPATITKVTAANNKKRDSNTSLPLRVFLGTGQYSHDTVIVSPVEKILIKWDPNATKPRQFERGADMESGDSMSAVGESTPYCDATSFPDPLLSELYS
ncbi:RNA polymerase II subunit A C-terminal domain phosphatase [Babesia microti strain RI]|uniref:protein-serine/threonine phosphatase n=1 Tax=Babesia microti (strain RI) TaxID=1133968 RepID=I7IP17_BABMR|nr:RNA polymerase II subunit A C-terminal domain phosphatase [Babesia microti strain RI]CCF72605.1 RNA polymerase II subunit A C-terminal domain phosphatase [Babesia microti strain RI]|eukprot:XP_012647214.1 RNA polymerase II subunit A C-terminal domain phosphatase [Babesia microti strain RI]